MDSISFPQPALAIAALSPDDRFYEGYEPSRHLIPGKTDRRLIHAAMAKSCSSRNIVGKTHRREIAPILKNLPYIDIADIYAEEPEGISNRQVFTLMLDWIENMIENGADAVVLEAYFGRRSYQREWLEFMAGRLDATVEYIELEAPLDVCIQRINTQLAEFKKLPGVAKGEVEKMERYTSARLEILQSYQFA